jgi:hypothetical protein
MLSVLVYVVHLWDVVTCFPIACFPETEIHHGYDQPMIGDSNTQTARKINLIWGLERYPAVLIACLYGVGADMQATSADCLMSNATYLRFVPMFMMFIFHKL